MAKKGLSSALGYNPYRDSEGKFDDGPSLLASRGRPKVSASDQRKKIDEAKAKLRAKYAIEEKPDRERVLDGPKYMETPGFAINEQNLPDNDVRTVLWKDKELFPGQTYGQYHETEKARKGDIFMMAPAEYRQALVESGQYKDLESIERRMDWEKVDQYTEDMMSGDKFPPPSLRYDEKGATEQEGLHRIYAAERVGIEEIPVVVSSDTRNQDIYPYKELSSKIVAQDELHDKHTSDAEITAESEQAPDPAANRAASDYEIKNANDYKNANQDLYSKWASELPSPLSEPTQEQLEAEKNYRTEAAELKRKLLASQDLLVEDGFYSYNGEIVQADSSSMSYLSISDDRAGFNVVPVNGTSSDAITIYDKSDLLPASKEDAIKGLNDGDTLGGISRSDEKLLARYTYLTPENKTLREGGSTADTDRIKDIIDNTYSAKEQTVYRGVPASQFADEILALEVGETYSDKGFMSTSKSQNVASEFAKDNGVMLELEVPSGLGIGISLAYLSQKPDEEEFLLNAGLEFEVVSKNGNNIKLKLKGSDNATPSADASANSSDSGQGADIEALFYAVSSYGEEHTQLQAKLNDPSITPSEEESMKKQLDETLKSAKIEAEKIIDKINQDEYDEVFIGDLQATIESEQATALDAKDQEYLSVLDDIMTAIFDKQDANDNTEDKSSSQSDDTSSPHLYNNQWPDYDMAAPEGYTILYTNTKSDNIDAIMADGLKVGLNADGYRLSPEEGNQVWTDTRSPGSMAYGGNTVAFKVKNEEAEAGKVNETQHAIPHDIAPEDIMFVDKVLKSDSGVKVSNLPEYIEKYGEEKAITVTAKTGDGFSEQELRDLISVYKSQSAAPATIEQEQDMSQSEGATPNSSKLSLASIDDFIENKDLLVKQDSDFYRADNLERLNDAIGFNGKPKTADKIPEGATQLHRVWADQAFYDSYMNDETPRLSVGIYGSGIYFSTSSEGARTSANTSQDKMVYSQAFIDPTAKGVDAAVIGDQMFEEGQEMSEMFDKELAGLKKIKDKVKRAEEEYRIQGAKRAAEALYKDAGLYAATKGYDYIFTSDNGSTDQQNEFIVINRAKVVFLNNPEDNNTANNSVGTLVNKNIFVNNQIASRDFPDLYKDIDIDVDDLGCIMLDLEPMMLWNTLKGTRTTYSRILSGTKAQFQQKMYLTLHFFMDY